MFRWDKNRVSPKKSCRPREGWRYVFCSKCNFVNRIGSFRPRKGEKMRYASGFFQVSVPVRGVIDIAKLLNC